LKSWLFLFECVAGSFARLAMDSDISNLLHPAARLGIECFQAADLQTIEEVLLDVSDRVLDAPFGENCALQIVEVSAQEFSLSHTLSIL